MRHVDIAVVGGGLAGSTAAAMLGRAGISAVLIDPHDIYPPDFRCEKLDGDQVATLSKTGLAPAVLAASTHDGDVWVARYGRVVDRRPSDQRGILYDTLVNTIRAEIPAHVEQRVAKVASIATSGDRQRLTLSSGEEISARLALLANGLNVGFGRALGLTREIISACHSITVGFDIKPARGATFDFPALTYYTELPARRVAYLTLFPIGATMRANLLVYRDMRDPWLKRMRDEPRAAMREIMPRLERTVGAFEVTGPVQIRPADLYVTHGVEQPGIVLVGDAFATSCPAAGTGTGRVFTDVERLCNVHIPAWLATPGMGFDKIADFYADPVKRTCDVRSHDKAYHVRSLSLDTTPLWRARRVARFAAGIGMNVVRRARRPRHLVTPAAEPLPPSLNA